MLPQGDKWRFNVDNTIENINCLVQVMDKEGQSISNIAKSWLYHKKTNEDAQKFRTVWYFVTIDLGTFE